MYTCSHARRRTAAAATASTARLQSFAFGDGPQQPDAFRWQNLTGLFDENEVFDSEEGAAATQPRAITRCAGNDLFPLCDRPAARRATRTNYMSKGLPQRRAGDGRGRQGRHDQRDEELASGDESATRCWSDKK